MKKIILISGKSGEGKDQSAQFIKELLIEKNNRVAITHYAKHMKDMMYELYNWDGIKNPWARQKLQWMGTEKIRLSMGMPDFHVNRTCENIDITQEDFDYYIIPDCRFPNEIDFVKDYFGENSVISIRVSRLNYESLLSPEAQLHPSETSLDHWDEWDYKIVALDNDLEGLKNQCKLIVDML